jgi:hypothetical protein
MINLPEWKLTLSAPLYDTSSVSPTEQTAQVYSKMRELVEEFNKFTASLSEEIRTLESETIGSIDTYKQDINKIVHNAICNFDNKILDLMNNIDKVVAEEVRKMAITYNPDTEEIVIGG